MFVLCEFPQCFLLFSFPRIMWLIFINNYYSTLTTTVVFTYYVLTFFSFFLWCVWTNTLQKTRKSKSDFFSHCFGESKMRKSVLYIHHPPKQNKNKQPLSSLLHSCQMSFSFIHSFFGWGGERKKIFFPLCFPLVLFCL